ncbi:MAG: hypothetical protein KDD55_04270 [Bdellovibrionales bacterium]|nr:hypothetical protein [Bdellovibrionales bacterium]
MNTSLILTGIICYLLGLFIGIFATRATFRARLKKAFHEGSEEGKKLAEEQTAAATEELGVQLSLIRDNLLHTFDAYQGALQVVDEKLRPGTLEQLSLSFESTEPKQIDFQPSAPQQATFLEQKVEVEDTLSSPQEIASSLESSQAESKSVVDTETEPESEMGASPVKEPSQNGTHAVLQ